MMKKIQKKRKEWLPTRVSLSILLLFLTFCLTGSRLLAQEEIFFVNKPNTGIKRIIECEIGDKNDTTQGFIYDYDTNGLLVKVTQPESHVLVDYQYDTIGRLIKVDALYGESFANGTTTYDYSDGNETETTLAMGYFTKKRKIFNKQGNISKLITYNIGGGMGNSYLKEEVFEYDTKGLLKKKHITIKRYDLNKEPGEFSENESNALVEELVNSELLKKDRFVEVYIYDTKKQLVKTHFKDLIIDKTVFEVEYIYNQAGKLAEKIGKYASNNKVDYTGVSFNQKHTINAYDENNELKTVTEKDDYYQLIKNYKEGRLVAAIQENNKGTI